MSIDNLIAATEAMNALTARMAGFMDGVDDDLAAHQAAYAALEGDLNGVVADQMYFTATVDPDEANPTNVRNGTFTTITAAIDAAPRGAYLAVTLAAGKNHVVSGMIDTNAKKIFLKGNGADPPTVTFSAYQNGTYNALYAFKPSIGARVYISYVDLVMGPKADQALGWSITKSLFMYGGGNYWDIGLNGVSFAGYDGGSILRVDAGMNADIRLNGVAVDGDALVVSATASGTATIAVSGGLTLTNGALAYDGGAVLGVNLLTNF